MMVNASYKKHHLVWIGLFILVLFTGDRTGAFLANQLVKASGFRYARLYNGEANADILLIGNSRGLCFYQPYLEAQIGIHTLNLSYNAMPLDLMEVLVSDYLSRYPTPQSAWIDITIADRVNPSLIQSFTPFMSFSDSLSRLIRQHSYQTSIATDWSHLYRYNSELFHRSLFYLGVSDEDWLLDRGIGADMLAKLTDDYEFYMYYPPEMIEVLGRLVDLLERKGVEVTLLVNPYFPPFREKIRDLDALIEEVEAYTKKEVLDYSRAVQDTSAFGDFQHLNKKGAKRYMDRLLADSLFAGE